MVHENKQSVQLMAQPHEGFSLTPVAHGTSVTRISILSQER